MAFAIAFPVAATWYIKAMATETHPALESLRLVTDEAIIEIDESTVHALASIAIRNGIHYAAALYQSICNEKFLGDLEDQGWRLLVRRRNGRIRHLERVEN